MNKKVAVIGAGFSGLAAASVLAKAGYSVTIFEKNDSIGGRARKFEQDGFVFDMGPSWYWMPEVFEHFFNHFEKTSSDFYQLVRLDPSYTVFFGKDSSMPLPADYQKLKELFESIEPGSGKSLDAFLGEAEYKYKVGMKEFVWKPGLSIMEFADIRVVLSLFKLQMLSSVASQVEKMFKNRKLREILKFPVLFLGATPENTPALYSLMNYADMKLGTWYPLGGMFKVIEAFESIARELGVRIYTGTPVEEIVVQDETIKAIRTNAELYDVDYVIGSADYHHVDQQLLSEEYRNYSGSYWDKRVLAPSSLLFYLGLSRKVKGLYHHNLFFDRNFDLHAAEIYTDPAWPKEPLFYICCPSKTDPTVAPEGYENIFILMPLAPGLNDSEELREQYFNLICDRIFENINQDIRKDIVFKRSYCINDFKSDYNAFKGNAYGLANTLTQTAFLKPKIKSDKVRNLYYAGQLTSPGPGMPPSIISGQVVASHIINQEKEK